MVQLPLFWPLLIMMSYDLVAKKEATLKSAIDYCDIPELGDPQPLEECSKPVFTKPCYEVQCIFEKSGFMIDKHTLNKESYKNHLLNWSKTHKGWEKGVEEAIQNCVNENSVIQSLEYPCKAHDIFICTTNALAGNCPDAAWRV